MNRRASPQRSVDEQVFPIRVKVRAPSEGFCEVLGRILTWLDVQIGPGGYGYHSGGALGCDALAFYFDSIEDAGRFLSAFPELGLANAAMTP